MTGPFSYAKFNERIARIRIVRIDGITRIGDDVGSAFA